MKNTSPSSLPVRDLQRRAQTARPPRRRRTRRRSRAARLELIDILSRASAAGLALVAGLGVYMVIVAGQVYPTRAGAWALMLLGALWSCRRLHGRYRSGGSISARPFRWRASYTACLSVLGVIFASAPILLTPIGAPFDLSLKIAALALVGSFGAAIAHAAYAPSAMAFAAPGGVLILLAAMRSGDGGFLVAALSVGVLGVMSALILSGLTARKADWRNPRTALYRRPRLRADDDMPEQTAAASKAAG